MLHFTTHAEVKAALAALAPHEILSGVAYTPGLAEDVLAHDPVNRDVRLGQKKKLSREMTGGYWDPRKSPPLRFLPDGRLADGQHRSLAVIETGCTIIVDMVVVNDTLGMDQSVVRSLADQLKIHTHLMDKTERELAALVTKQICRIPLATDREQVAFFEANREFIMTCVRKPLAWLEDKLPSVAAVMKPTLLAVTRAQEIMLHEQPTAEVDELLEDLINGGHTAPEGSLRRQIARQIWDAMQAAHTKKGARPKDVLKWVSVGLEYKRKGVSKSVMLARFPGKGRGKKAKAPGQPPQQPPLDLDMTA